MPLSLGITKIISGTVGKLFDKLWMDQDEKARLDFSKEELASKVTLKLAEMEQSGELAELELEFREAQAQRDYAHKQFGTAETLKTFFVGKVILMGRASIRWVITGYAMWQASKIVDAVLSPDVMKALANGELDIGAVWVVALVIGCMLGIPLAYVTGVSVEKILKSRGVI